MAEVAFLAGAFIPTFLLSRLFLWLLKRWNSRYPRIALSHAASLFLMAGIYHFAGDHPFFNGVLAYVLPQAVWLIFDVVKRPKRTESAATNSN